MISSVIVRSIGPLNLMARFEAHRGDLFESQAIALINPVNCVGVAGKGLALAFRQRFPDNHRAYVEACRSKRLKIGTVLSVVFEDSPLRYIVNFPTKLHWKDPSQYGYIHQSLQALAQWLKQEAIASVAMPRIGCGLGGLDWRVIEQVIRSQLNDVETLVELYGDR